MAIALTAFAGCGGSEDPLTAVSKAVDTSLPYVFITTQELSGAEALGSQPGEELRGGGAFDVERGRGFTQVIYPDVEANGKRSQAYLFFMPTVIYLHPTHEERLPAGKRLVSVPITGPMSTTPGASAFVAQAMGLNPALLLDELKAGATAATETASLVIRHVPIVDYRVTVDLRRALAGVRGPYAPAERVAIRHELAALGRARSTAQIEVRVDGGGFVRRLRATIPGSKLGRVELNLRNFGSTFNVAHPANAEIVPFASLAEAWGWSPHWPWVLGS